MSLLSLVATLSLDSSKYEQGLNDAEGKAKGFGSALTGGLKTAAGVAVKAVAAAGAAVTAFAGQSVKVGAGFDSAMSQVSATYGYSVAELNDKTSEASQNFEMLRNYAQEMGASTAFSASQAADAMNILAMAGYDAKEVVDTLPDVLNMAAAGGLSIADAADYATGIIAGFSNETLDAGTIADKLATIASSAKGDVQSFGEALSTVAGMANTTGQSMNDMTVALGILGNNNVSASEAGNALSRTLKNLYQPTDSAAEGLADLGVSAYDAEGKARPLQDVLIDLNKGLDGMSDAQKNAALSKIFDAATLKTVPALLNNATTSWNELDAALQDSAGAAEKMAAVQLDNLEGDITLFKSALEGAQIAISDGLTPTLREFVQFGGTALQDMTMAFKEGGLDGLMEAFGTALSEGLNKIIEMLPTVVDAGMKLLGALGQGILDNIPQIVDAAVKIVKQLLDGIVQALPLLADGAIQIILELSNGLIEVLPELVPAVVEVILKILDALVENAPMICDAGIQIIFALVEGIINSLPTLLEQAPVILAKWVAVIIENSVKMFEASHKIVEMMAQGIVNNLPKLKEAGLKMFESVKQIIVDKVHEATQWGRDLIGNFISGIKAKWEDLKGAMSGAAGLIGSYMHFSEPDVGPLSDFHTYAPDMMKLFAQGIKDNEHLVTDQIDKSFDFGDQIVGATPSVSGAPVTINVYGAEGQNERDIAEEVMNRLRREYDRGRAVYA